MGYIGFMQGLYRDYVRECRAIIPKPNREEHGQRHGSSDTNVLYRGLRFPTITVLRLW